MTLLVGGNNPANALLFAYMIPALMNPDIQYMRSRANLLALMFLVVAIGSFVGYFIYQWSFGYSAERMVRPSMAVLITG